MHKGDEKKLQSYARKKIWDPMSQNKCQGVATALLRMI